MGNKKEEKTMKQKILEAVRDFSLMVIIFWLISFPLILFLYALMNTDAILTAISTINLLCWGLVYYLLARDLKQ